MATLTNLYKTRIRRKTGTNNTTLTDQDIEELWDEGNGDLPGKSQSTIAAWVVLEWWINKQASLYEDVDVKMGDISEKLSQRFANVEKMINRARKEFEQSLNKDSGILISAGNASRRRPLIEYELPTDRTGMPTDDYSNEDVP